jgi:hypothetical protein
VTLLHQEAVQRRRRPRLAETADQLPGGLGTDASSEDPAQDVSERAEVAHDLLRHRFCVRQQQLGAHINRALLQHLHRCQVAGVLAGRQVGSLDQGIGHPRHRRDDHSHVAFASNRVCG